MQKKDKNYEVIIRDVTSELGKKTQYVKALQKLAIVNENEKNIQIEKLNQQLIEDSVYHEKLMNESTRRFKKNLQAQESSIKIRVKDYMNELKVKSDYTKLIKSNQKDMEKMQNQSNEHMKQSYEQKLKAKDIAHTISKTLHEVEKKADVEQVKLTIVAHKKAVKEKDAQFKEEKRELFAKLSVAERVAETAKLDLQEHFLKDEKLRLFQKERAVKENARI